jgi:hypothetical protein
LTSFAVEKLFIPACRAFTPSQPTLKSLNSAWTEWMFAFTEWHSVQAEWMFALTEWNSVRAEWMFALTELHSVKAEWKDFQTGFNSALMTSFAVEKRLPAKPVLSMSKGSG